MIKGKKEQTDETNREKNTIEHVSLTIPIITLNVHGLSISRGYFQTVYMLSIGNYILPVRNPL